MALTFLGVDEFKIAGPPQWRLSMWDLDSLVVPYSGPIDALDIFLDTLEQGTEYADDEFMFLAEWNVSNPHRQYPVVDLIYQGKRGGVLPPTQNNKDDAVMSASSSRGLDGTILAQPITVQYYGPSTEATWYSYNAEGVHGTVSDPTDEIRVISLTIGDASYAPSGLLSDVVARFFTPQIINTLSSQEVIDTKYWKNTERKTKTLNGWIFTVAVGDYIVMFSPGHDYSVGNGLTMTDGSHTAHITVESLGIGDSIVGYTVVSNTFDYDTRGTGPIYTSGGSGTGAAFYNIHIA